ncbi:hypothetical protein AMTR_s00036p00059060 [Amborella trichopoda]|uniref:Uncharacterized protein n=1 Tax=Amborella trichopoda TaxID=13333 RepID=U5D1M1_AMBTC|nr:hypothetical protein AMTR_s00036p00059060 [Amborella trichopoda]
MVDYAPEMELLEPQHSSYGGPRSYNGASGATTLRLWWTTFRQWCFWSHDAPAMDDCAPVVRLLASAFVLFISTVVYDSKGWSNV